MGFLRGLQELGPVGGRRQIHSGFKLPRTGKAGDLLVTLKKTDPPFATLWFCEISGGVGQNQPNAVWREVLLGPEIPGTEPA
jgi:hypothetical protein